VCNKTVLSGLLTANSWRSPFGHACWPTYLCNQNFK
jgi:hypothetical protein